MESLIIIHQSLPICCCLASLGGIFEVAATAVTAIPTIRYTRGKKEFTTILKYGTLLLNIVLQAIGSLLSHLIATWFGPISIVVPFFYSSTLLTNMIIFGILFRNTQHGSGKEGSGGDEITKNMKVGTYVIVVAVILLPIVGPTPQNDQHDVMILIVQHWYAMIWFILLLVPMTGTAILFIVAAIQQQQQQQAKQKHQIQQQQKQNVVDEENKNNNNETIIPTITTPCSSSSSLSTSTPSSSSCSSSSSSSSSSILTGYTQHQRIIILIVARATSISINLTVSRSFILQPTSYVLIILIILKIISGAIYTSAIVIQSTAITQQVTFVPLNATIIILINAITGILIWDDYKVVNHWYGYICIFILLGLGCDLLLSVPTLLHSDNIEFSAPRAILLQQQQQKQQQQQQQQHEQQQLIGPSKQLHYHHHNQQQQQHGHDHYGPNNGYQSIGNYNDEFLQIAPDFDHHTSTPTPTPTPSYPKQLRFVLDNKEEGNGDGTGSDDRGTHNNNNDDGDGNSPTRREAWRAILSPARRIGVPRRMTTRTMMENGTTRDRAWSTGLISIIEQQDHERHHLTRIDSWKEETEQSPIRIVPDRPPSQQPNNSNNDDINNNSMMTMTTTTTGPTNNENSSRLLSPLSYHQQEEFHPSPAVEEQNDPLKNIHSYQTPKRK